MFAEDWLVPASLGCCVNWQMMVLLEKIADLSLMNIQGEKKTIKVAFLSATFDTSNSHILSLLQMPAKGFSS